MTPVEQAKQVYQQEPCARTFEEDIHLHLMHGYVFSTPYYFVMGRAVLRGGCPNEIVNSTFLYAPWRCDCWHVYLFAGDMNKALSMFPYPLPWVSFERQNKLRFYPFDRLNHLITKLK